MARKITMTGKNAQYIERRGTNATPDDREIRMEGAEAVYQEMAYGQAATTPQDETARETAKETARQLLTGDAEYIDPIEPIETDEASDCYRRAIQQMQEEGLLKKKNYWGLLMAVMNQTDGLPHFDTPRSFVEYLRGTLRLDDLPSESSVGKMLSKMRGMFPDWRFDDTNDTVEVNRRVNVGKRFLSAVRKPK